MESDCEEHVSARSDPKYLEILSAFIDVVAPEGVFPAGCAPSAGTQGLGRW